MCRSSLFLINAVSEPPARYQDIGIGALPLAKILTTALRELQMEIGKCTSAASIRCCMRSPGGPQAVSLGNERRTDMILNSGGRAVVPGGKVISGRVGIGPLGCFCWSKFHVSGLLGAMPEDVRILQAFPSNPSLALETAD